MEVIAWIIGLAIIILIAKLLGRSLKLILKILANSILGLICLKIFNFLASFIGLYIEVNFINCLVVGVFGIVGLIFLLIIQLI